MSKEFINKCNEFIENCASEDLINAIARVEKEKIGEGCGCINCANEAITEVNNCTVLIL